MERKKKHNKGTTEHQGAGVIDITIKPNDGHGRSAENAADIARLAKLHRANRSAERSRRNAMLAISYRMEHYVQDNKITAENLYKIEDFVKEFLMVLGISKTAFAHYIEIDISNLNKYYGSGRRFNTELALKFGHFFHTPADLWLKIQAKNEFLILQKEKQLEDKYRKYDYEKVLQIA
jgi:antitoxin HigA-1